MSFQRIHTSNYFTDKSDSYERIGGEVLRANKTATSDARHTHERYIASFDSRARPGDVDHLHKPPTSDARHDRRRSEKLLVTVPFRVSFSLQLGRSLCRDVSSHRLSPRASTNHSDVKPPSHLPDSMFVLPPYPPLQAFPVPTKTSAALRASLPAPHERISRHSTPSEPRHFAMPSPAAIHRQGLSCVQ